MAIEQRTHVINLGAACILVSSDLFMEGLTTAWLQFYDLRYRPSFPLTTETIGDFIVDFMNCTNRPIEWRVGAVTGWLDALFENSDETFTSVDMRGMKCD